MDHVIPLKPEARFETRSQVFRPTALHTDDQCHHVPERIVGCHGPNAPCNAGLLISDSGFTFVQLNRLFNTYCLAEFLPVITH